MTLPVLTHFYYSHIIKNALPPRGHVFQPTGTIVELAQDIIGTNLTKFMMIGQKMWPLES